ncbi:MAG: hypothetical protein KJ077_10480 [Anaerolineae bacterium]|nr:hypothetical protein [Anaerolineae bacterium]
MATAAEVSSQILDEWLKLEALKAVVTSPAGTYHDTASGKFTSKPGGAAGGKGGGKAGAKGGGGGGGRYGDKGLKHGESAPFSDNLDADGNMPAGGGKITSPLGKQPAFVANVPKHRGKSLAQVYKDDPAAGQKLENQLVDRIVNEHIVSKGTSSTTGEGKPIPGGGLRPRRQAYASSISRDVTLTALNNARTEMGQKPLTLEGVFKQHIGRQGKAQQAYYEKEHPWEPNWQEPRSRPGWKQVIKQ